jgi:hypothetical protein
LKRGEWNVDTKLSYLAVVQKVIPRGRHGPYAVTTAKKIEEGSVTFSLNKPTWREGKWPEEGTIVVLTDLRRKKSGWRAENARCYQPTDEEQ